MFFFISNFLNGAPIHCELAGAGSVTWVAVNFEDDDGDCMSDTYEVWHTMSDGSVVYTPWPDQGQVETWGTLDFNHWECCKDKYLT